MSKDPKKQPATTNRPPSSVGYWAIEKTGFDDARRILALRKLKYPGPIALIDSGKGALGNPVLGNPTCIPPSGIGTVSANANPEGEGSHAAEVAGVIALACPEAELVVYNIATTAGPDRDLFLAALEDVPKRAPKPSVVNISLGWLDPDPRVDKAIKDCVAAGVVVVAAMGEFEEPSDFESYPAACKDVIAVGATDRFDLRLPGSSVGNHIWIAAPGEDVDTVVTETDTGVKSGTSFATALVSAGAWIGRWAKPGATPIEIRRLLGDSADATLVGKGAPKDLEGSPNGTWDPSVGCGRLDVAKLVTLVPPPAVPEEPLHARG